MGLLKSVHYREVRSFSKAKVFEKADEFSKDLKSVNE